MRAAQSSSSRAPIGGCEFDWDQRLDPFEVVHLASGRVVADESYCYQLTVTGATNSGYHGGPAACRRVRPLDWSLEHHEDSGATLTLLGQLDFGPRGPTGVRLEHQITFAGSGEIIEQLALSNHAGRDHLRLDDVRFGFRKTLFDRGRSAWRPGCDRAELVPVPLRRYRAQDVDHLLSGYRAYDLYPSEWPGRHSLPGRSSEAWLWAEEDGGFLVAKYSQEHAEFSLADGEHVVARRSAGEAASLQLDQLHSDRNLCLRHGGAGVHDGFPEHAGELGPGQRLRFGSSTIVAYDGDWQAGCTSVQAAPPGQGPPHPGRLTTRRPTGTSCTASDGAVDQTRLCRSCPRCSRRPPGPRRLVPRRSTSTPDGTCSREAPSGTPSG